MIDTSTMAMSPQTAALYAARVAPPPPMPEGNSKPDQAVSKPMSAAGDVPNLAALGVYSDPTRPLGAPGQSEESSSNNNGRKVYNDAVAQVRQLSTLKAASGYAQAGQASVPMVQPVVETVV